MCRPRRRDVIMWPPCSPPPPLLPLLLLTLFSYVGAAHVYLDNDGPAVVGAPIMFTARVVFAGGERRPETVYYEWSDNASPAHRNTSAPTSSLTATMLLVFNNTATFGYYQMYVRVKEPRHILPDWVIGEQSTLFSITVNLNGGIILSQQGVVNRQPGHVSTMNETLLTVQFRDPHHFLDSATKIEYFWSVNDTRNLGPYDHPDLRYNFTQTGPCFVRCISVAYFNGNESLGIRDNSKWGQFSLNFQVDAPITQVNISGNNWVRHGQLLNLTMHCNGTGPWQYCVTWYSGRHNVTAPPAYERPPADEHRN